MGVVALGMRTCLGVGLKPGLNQHEAHTPLPPTWETPQGALGDAGDSSFSSESSPLTPQMHASQRAGTPTPHPTPPPCAELTESISFPPLVLGS